MALDEATKAANKAVQKIRDAAFSKRRKEREVKKAAAAAIMAASPEDAATILANRKMDEALEARNAHEQKIRAQIAELESKMKSPELTQAIEEARKERDVSNKARRALEERLDAEIDAEFPDIDGVWGPAGWTPPEGYIDEFKRELEATPRSKPKAR